MIPFDLNWAEAYTILKPLVPFLFGVTIYSIFIYKFYKFLARKDVFELNLRQYSKSSFGFIKAIIGLIFYVIEYIVLFPIFVFFWFTILAFLLTFLAKDQTANSVLLVSVSVVGAIRIAAYYHEDLSNDLAKMIPFALLGVFLVNISFFDFYGSLAIVKEFPSMAGDMLYYLLFIVGLEFVLRIGSTILSPFLPKQKKSE